MQEMKKRAQFRCPPLPWSPPTGPTALQTCRCSLGHTGPWGSRAVPSTHPNELEQSGHWENQVPRAKKKKRKLEPYLTQYIKINSPWIRGLTVRAEAIQLRANAGEPATGLGRASWDAQTAGNGRNTNTTTGFAGIENCCGSKGIIKAAERRPDGRENVTHHLSDRGWCPETERTRTQPKAPD